MGDEALGKFERLVLIGQADQGLAYFHGWLACDLVRKIGVGGPCSGNELMVDQLLAQGVAVDPEDLGSEGLVAACLL